MWLLSQCTDCETKQEYDRSHTELTKFLQREHVQGALSQECIAAVTSLQDNLKTKEYKLAGYIRMDRMNCMDACTTSPVEGNNNAIKHGPSRLNSNLNIDNMTKKLVDGIQDRLRKRINGAIREMNKSNKASRAPTKEYLIRKGQGLVDRHYDERRFYKTVQLAPTKWIAWNFNNVDPDDLNNEMEIYLPRFVRVRELNVSKLDCGKNFVSCTCGMRTRAGVPCSCFFAISDNDYIEEEDIVDVGMVDARYLKTFNAHYGEDTKLGAMLYDAQEQCFEYEGEGIQISDEFMCQLVGNDEEQYPKMGKNTSEEEFKEAMYVMERADRQSTTRFDLERWRMFEDGWDSDTEDAILPNDNTIVSRASRQMQENIAKARAKTTEKEDDKILAMEEKKVDALRKALIEDYDSATKDERVTDDMMKELEEDLNNAFQSLWCKTTGMWGEEGGGEGSTEFYGTTGKEGPERNRKKGPVG